jgi:hypothetical protein
VAVAIYRLLQNSAFGPEEIEQLTAAYESALRALPDHRDCRQEDHRNRQIGVRDPAKIRALAIENLGS